MRDKHAEADKGSGDDPDRSDSPWAVIAGVMKAFRLPFDTVLHRLSYTNVMLLSASLPVYRTPEERRRLGLGNHQGGTDGSEALSLTDHSHSSRIYDFLNAFN